MSDLVTLEELKDEFLTKLPGNCNITEDDFIDLANRAAKALYKKTTLIGMMDEVISYPTNDNVIEVDTCSYSHALAFKVDCKAYRIVTLPDTWKLDRAGYDSFVDLGYDKDNFNRRLYRIPECLHDNFEGKEFKSLVKIKFCKVKCDSDYFQIASLEAIKSAMTALLHEDNSDLDSAAKYWAFAVQYANEEAREFRGPVMPTITHHDTALTDVNENLI